MREPLPVSIRKAGADDLPVVLSLYAQPELDDGDALPLDDASRILRCLA